MQKEIELTEDQKKALSALMSGKNCFITGDAGTGKSFVINTYLKEMKEMKKNIVITASTGIAAYAIDGVTFHRAFGFPTQPLVPASDFKNNITNTLKCADIIVVDEISMIRRDVWDVFCMQLAKVEADTKKSIQVIAVGDFNQLPPVMRKQEAIAMKQFIPDIGNGYAFVSPFWRKLDFTYIKLKEVIRQKDADFIFALNELKKGNVDAVRWFNQSITKPWDGETTVLCSTNEEVKKINDDHINKLSTKPYVYTEYVRGAEITDNDRHNDKEVTLKVGAKVMCLINDKERRYQNGSVGIITHIDEKEPHNVSVLFPNQKNPIVFEYYHWEVKEYSVSNGKLNTKVVSEIEQIPLRLAYALTIHKSQGQTYDNVAIKPDNIWIPGQMYVALSRCTSIEGIQLLGNLSLTRLTPWGKQEIVPLADQVVLRFYNSIDS